MPNPMRAMYDRLGTLGFPKKYVRETILPAWWDDEAASSPAGYAEAVLLVSRHLGLDARALRNPEAELRPSIAAPCRFKRAKNASAADVSIARQVAVQAVRMATAAMASTPLHVPASAADVRRAVLDEGHPWVSLEHLLDVAWSAGIPVLHVSAFPRGAKRMHGMAACVDGRPAIVVAKEARTSAWLLFIVAHELGHIVLGHLSDNEVILDEEVDEESEDVEEAAANAFALEVLAGSAQFRVHTTGRWPNAEALANGAKRMGAERKVDPGHIVLNYAHTMGPTFFPVANAALARIDGGSGGADTIRRFVAERLDWSALPDDSSEFLARVTRAAAQPS